jgi:hypothetical protein
VQENKQAREKSAIWNGVTVFVAPEKVNKSRLDVLVQFAF